MQRKSAIFINNGMTGIGAALEADDKIRILG